MVVFVVNSPIFEDLDKVVVSGSSERREVFSGDEEDFVLFGDEFVSK